jgi:threonine dehydratase
MPASAPADRKATIESFGVGITTVDIVPTSDKLMERVEQLVHNDGMSFMHPFDDINLIRGYATIALEIAEQLPSSSIVDGGKNLVVFVPCGGGGLLAGVALGFRRLGYIDARIIGVEPEGAPGQYEAREQGKVGLVNLKPTTASGLAPPFAGKVCFEFIQKYVNDLVLVSDMEITVAMK